MAYLDSNGLETQISYIKGYVQGELSNFTPSGSFLPLAGGTMSGNIQYVNNGKVFAVSNTTTGNVDLGWSWDNREGAGLGLRSTDYGSEGSINAGEFTLFARDANNSRSLTGKPNGTLTWDGNKVATFDSNNKLVFPDGTTVWIS